MRSNAPCGGWLLHPNHEEIPMPTPSFKALSKALLCGALCAFGAVAQAQQVFRVSASPDESPTDLACESAPL